MGRAAFNMKKTPITSTLDLNLRKILVKSYIWSIALNGAENWTLQKVDQKYPENFEMCYWRSMEKISWTEHVRNEELLCSFKEERNTLHTVKTRLTGLVTSCIGTAF